MSTVMNDDTMLSFCSQEGLQTALRALGGYPQNAMSKFSVVNPRDPQKAHVQKVIDGEEQADEGALRALGSVMGMICGDALGAPLEFSSVVYGVKELRDMGDKCWENGKYNRFLLKPGQWTDDSSMGLCLADSLLVNKGFNAIDLRLRFHNWWHFGLNNAFGFDPERRPGNSVGLGGNISGSLREFEQFSDRTETQSGDTKTSGNGSIMRAAPLPVYYHNSYEDALKYSRLQSKTTHQGHEAAECCALMADIIVRALHHEEKSPAELKRALLGDMSRFKTEMDSVAALAMSKQEEGDQDNSRNWNWKDPKFRYCTARASQQPGYIGSYCMDALSMALHCVWTTESFEDALLKCVNLRGDSDSVGSVCGQIAGAIYGVRAIPRKWINCVQRWDQGGTVALRAWKLYFQDHPDYKFSSTDCLAPQEIVAGVKSKPSNKGPGCSVQ